jgi:hypothetical protein
LPDLVYPTERPVTDRSGNSGKIQLSLPGNK